MSIQFDALYYLGGSSRAYPVRVLISEMEGVRLRSRSPSQEEVEHGLANQLEAGTQLPQAQISELRINPRVGNGPCSILLPAEDLLETRDGAAVDDLIALRKALGHGGNWHFIHQLERSLPWALAAMVGVIAALGAFSIWGVPWLAREVAYRVPDELAFKMGQGTLTALDKSLFQPSDLPKETQQRLRGEFGKMRDHYPRLPLTLFFRKATFPNAFALPDGSVIVTDELVELAEDDDEVLAVLAHEIGHVQNRHSLRMLLESSAVGLIAFTVAGDASQVAGVLSALPAIYANAHFSQEHEREADLFALGYMKQVGIAPRHFATMMQRLEKNPLYESESGREGENPSPSQAPADESDENESSVGSFLSSHPPTRERIQLFLDAEAESKH